jgi:hypothetical protein
MYQPVEKREKVSSVRIFPLKSEHEKEYAIDKDHPYRSFSCGMSYTFTAFA